MSIRQNLKELADRWANADAGERANFQLYLSQLCRALDVPEPEPRGSGYEFEFMVKVVEHDGTETTKPADLFKRDYFLLEAKDIEEGKSDEALLRKAYGQARGYITHLPGNPPPYVLVLDVAREMLVWDRWSGTYGGFTAAHHIDLRVLHEDPDEIDLLRDIWTAPERLDPRAKASAVTQEIAEHLAQLASSLEERGHTHEEVARFLIRAVFSMFAEDVDLLKGQPFLEAVQAGLENGPDYFKSAVERLWTVMDEGGEFGVYPVLRFNGHFFKDRSVLPLDRDDLVVLLEAAKADWRFVEPSIFGTLFTRALDAEERHKLGAEFTPREFVERLVRPTLEEPIRERWRTVEASVFQLRQRARRKAKRGRREDLKEAKKHLNEFHNWLRSLEILDPACGSGNFLYVSLSLLKRIELEVLRTLEDLTGEPDLMVQEVGPWQFHGIEKDAWAREIAELTLWIGYHQAWQEHHRNVRPPEPVLQDTGNLECRDAVLVWDDKVERPEKARPDATPKAPHPITGELVPDPNATVKYWEHTNARPAEWPNADFIVGNPPYMGDRRMRQEFGDGYVEALRAAYPKVPDGSDYVMYWWYRAVEKVLSGETIRAGLITTNTITQSRNRSVVAAELDKGAEILWAIPDHPWVDEASAADVRVAMTVIGKDGGGSRLVSVSDAGTVLEELKVDRVNPDLTGRLADVSRASEEPLIANAGLCFAGFILIGKGFQLNEKEARQLLAANPEAKDVVRPYRNGRDLTQHSRDRWVMDFGMREEAEAREYPEIFDLVRTRVKPQRDNNNKRPYREIWWRFGEPQPSLREATEGLERYIATSETAKHRIFAFLPANVAPDFTLRVVASDDAYHLGVLSSRIHVVWALAAGGTLEDRPRYNNSLCFDPFPFPDADAELQDEIRAVAERIDAHRWKVRRAHEAITFTGMYNVVEKLVAGEQLSADEREIHDLAACSTLRDWHDELDELVARAYGWPWPLDSEAILARLVELHDSRLKEEQEGTIRFLRPGYQAARFAPKDLGGFELELEVEAEQAPAVAWPRDDAIGQISAIKTMLAEAPGTAKDVCDRFEGGQQALVARHLETLVLLGEARQSEDGRYHSVEEPVAV